MDKNQLYVLKITNELSKKYSEDFKQWVRDHIDFTGLILGDLTEQQYQVAQAVIEKRKVAVPAGTGVGKTAVSALLTIWFLCTHRNSKVPITAPTGKQLHDNLWSEIGFWLKRCDLAGLFQYQKTRLYIRGFEEWYAVPRTVSKESRELNDTLAGFHAEHLLIIVDEASGVPDPVFTALSGAMTQKHSYILLISNPVSTSGYFYDTITDPKGKGSNFEVIFLDSRKSELVDPEYEKYIITRYGKESPMYRAKVCGEPISVFESSVIDPATYDKITSEQRYHMKGRVILSVDVGGEGPDLSIILHRIGNSLVKWEEHAKNDEVFLAEAIIETWKTLYQGKDFCVIVDAHGIGHGVYSILKRKELFQVYDFKGPEKAFHDTMFKNKRTEAYYKLHKSFEDLHFPAKPPERLKKELTSLQFDFRAEPIEMTPKKNFIKTNGFSPDYADALAMSCVVENYASMISKPFVPKGINVFRKLKRQPREKRYGRFSMFM